MKYIKLYFILFAFGFLAGCFEDEGNYTYSELNPPTWVEDFNDRKPKNITGYAGEMMRFRGSSMFRWEVDSASRAQEVRYEWKIGDVVISEELDFDMPTQEVVEKLNLKRYSNDKGEWGTFNVIEKATGVVFPARLLVYFYPTFATSDWYILSENNGKSKVSAVCRRAGEENGKSVWVYDLKDNVYESINGHEIPGRPLDLVMETSRDVSPSGACVILTDQVAYEVNLQDMVKVSEVKDQFLDGTPADFNIAMMKEKAPQSPSFGEGSASFVVTEDGRLFTRMRSANYLTGKYLTEPYYIDAKGYNITKIGHSRYGQMIPCYDEKNRRVVMATTWREDVNESGEMGQETSVFKTRIVVPSGTNVGPEVYGFPEGTEVLFISVKSHGAYYDWYYGGTTALFTVYFNDPNRQPKTLAWDFSFDNRSGSWKKTGVEDWYYFPMKLDASSVFLTSGTLYTGDPARDRDFYSVGNELYYMQRDPGVYGARPIKFNASFPSKITALAYDFRTMTQLWVGCEDGSIYAYNISNISSPQLFLKKNIGGKVVSMKQIGWHSSYDDWY